MTHTMHEVTGVGPLGHAEAMALQAAELEATLQLLHTLDERSEERRVGKECCR